MVGSAFLLGSLILSLPLSSLAGTACADSGMDWYTNLVGETPCRTYERLRQICNPQYQVGIQNPNTPPDFCDEQVADCCCNSISFSLSMLCLTCQQGFSKNPNGFDAGVGAYQDYLTAGRTGFCSPNTNKTLPNNIQQGVCNQNIKIFDDLYGLFWSDGSWFYQFTQQTINKDIATFANNTFTHCDSTTIHSTTLSNSSPSSSSSSSPSSSSSSATSPGTGSDNSQNSSSSSLGAGAIAGIAIGGLLVVILAGLVFWWWRKQEAERTRRKYTSGLGILDGGGRSSPVNGAPPPTAQISPFPYSYSSVPTTHSRTTSSNQTPFGDQNAYTGSSANVSSAYPQSQSGSSGYGSSAASGPGHGHGSGYGSGSDSGPGIVAGAAGGISNTTRSRSTRKPPLPPIPSQNPTQHSPERDRDQEYGFNPYSISQPHAQNSGSLSSPSERHTDGGPVPESMLQRSDSGRLPPAYGEQFGR